jgi:hypothetical protein
MYLESRFSPTVFFTLTAGQMVIAGKGNIFSG